MIQLNAGDAMIDGFQLSATKAFGEANSYLRFRAARLAAEGLAEKSDQAPPESLLQQVWLYQRVLRDRLKTMEGKPVRILHPGFWNREPGPDFRKALVQIGSDAAISGDVEIDIVPAGWEHHAHAGNPAYANVVLHVTWEPATESRGIPSICLKHALDASIQDLAFWLGSGPRPEPEALPGKCSGPFRTMDAQSVREVIRQAAQARLGGKAEQLLARARQVGWHGALWEGAFGALGYKQNIWPMRRIAELLPLLTTDLPHAKEASVFVQSRFLGASGMLPSDPRHAKGSEEYVRKIWDLWWREADRIREHALPKQAWQFAGIRPVNHPQRRLALAAHWVARGQLPRQLELWLERTIGGSDLLSSLEELLQVKHDEYWSYRCTLRAAPGKTAQPLLGAQRITDLAVNVILPWLYVRAWAGKNQALASAAEARYFLWPAGEDNAVLKLARQRLFGGIQARAQKTAAEQQGIMQIVRDFCDYSNAACEHCQFPDLLHAVAQPYSTGA